MSDKLIPMSEGVKILYKGAIDNIIFLKRQQWVITNYALVVYAAVVTLSKGATINEKWALSIFATVGWAYGSWCIVHTQKTLTLLRGSLHHIYQTFFTDEERSAFKLWQQKPTFHYTPEFIYGLLITHVAAIALTLYLIWFGAPNVRTQSSDAQSALDSISSFASLVFSYAT